MSVRLERFTPWPRDPDTEPMWKVSDGDSFISLTDEELRDLIDQAAKQRKVWPRIWPNIR